MNALLSRAPRATFVAVVLLASVNIIGSRVEAPFYDPQQGAVTRGAYVARFLGTHRVGACHAGILGFSSGGRVINLDGLVNDDVVAWIFRNDLAGYLLHERIDVLVQPPPHSAKRRRLLGMGRNLVARAVRVEWVRWRGRSFSILWVDRDRLTRLRRQALGRSYH